MLPETREEDAALWANRTRERLGSLVIPVGAKKLRVTASFGAAQKTDGTRSAEELVDQADQSLLCAKQSGRDRVVRYESLSTANEVDLEEADNQRNLFRGITAAHVMSPLVACLREDETVGQAAEFFLRSRINSSPVVDSEGKLSGILSEKDLLAAMVSLDCWSVPVREVMKPNVVCYEEETPIRVIYEFLCRVSIRRVVIAKDERPRGTISRSTLLRWFRNLVCTKGLLTDSEASKTPPVDDSQQAKGRLAETTQTMAQLASELKRRLHEDADDLVPYVVGSATQIQDLVNDLLAYSRYAGESNATGAAALQSLLLSSSYTD